MSTFIRGAILAVFLAGIAPSLARGQDSGARVRIAVVDGNGAPLPGVAVVVSHDTVGAVLLGTTNAGGVYSFGVDVDGSQYVVTARRVGFSPAQQALTLEPGANVSYTLVLRPIAVSLDTVKVNVEELPSKHYLIVAADLANTGRTIDNAYDAANKLYPNMLGDRERLCPIVKNVWINGRRVFFGAPSASVARMPVTSVPMGTSSDAMRARAVPRSVGSASGNRPPKLGDILKSIKADDLESMRYVNCWDTATPEIGTNDALFIVLKPGIVWDWKNGSHPAAADSVPRSH